MTAADPDLSHLPPWFPDAMLAAHLRFGPGVHFPGPIEEALIRGTEQCFIDLTQDEKDARRCRWAFREFTDPNSPWSGRGILAGVLKTIALEADHERWRRDAALLALVALVVLEDRDPEVGGRKRTFSAQLRLAYIMCTSIEDGNVKQEPMSGDTGCRPYLHMVVSAGPADFSPQAFVLARDVLDRVRPGSDDSAFIREHRDLLEDCAMRREKERAFISAHRLLREARVYSFCNLAGFVGQPLTKWTSVEDPLESAVGRIVAEVLELQPILAGHLAAAAADLPAPENREDEDEDDGTRIAARLALLKGIRSVAGAEGLGAPEILRLLAAGAGLAAILMAESSADAPLPFLDGARGHPAATAELRSFCRQVQERLITADTDEGRRKIASEVWQVVESDGPAKRVDVSETAVEPPGQTTEEAAPTLSKRPGAGDAVPCLPRFTGSGVSWHQAVDMLKWSISPDGLRKKAEAAPENDPLHVLGAEGPGRIPDKARNYLRSDAVGWVKLQCEAVISAELEKARAEKRATASSRLSDSAVRKLSRIIR